MAKPRFGLGRGLDALIPGASADPEADAPPTVIPQAAPLEVSIDAIQPNPNQPRGLIPEDDAFFELAASIKEHGVIQPLVVTEVPAEDQVSQQDGAEIVRYQLIAGERRWRASRLAGLAKVPVIVREATPQQLLELALIENIQRSDLNPIEEALAYQTLVNEYGLTQDEVGKRVGKSREAVANAIRLLSLPKAAREKLANRSQEFTAGHARAVLRIQNEDAQRHAIQQIMAQGLNVRQAEELARQLTDVSVQHQPAQPSQPQTSEDFDLTRSLQDQFLHALAMKVQLRRNAQDKGSLTIFFNNGEELNALYELLVAARQDVR
ncbi:MAG TPA: ParB/RepB/Spo0J family partition protein [Ktedonobacterales bacterium]